MAPRVKRMFQKNAEKLGFRNVQDWTPIYIGGGYGQQKGFRVGTSDFPPMCVLEKSDLQDLVYKSGDHSAHKRMMDMLRNADRTLQGKDTFVKDVEKKDEQGDAPRVNGQLVRRITKPVSDRISAGRHLKGLKQDELARACQMPLALLRDYEKGTGIVNEVYIQRLSDALDVRLSRRTVAAPATAPETS